MLTSVLHCTRSITQPFWSRRPWLMLAQAVEALARMSAKVDFLAIEVAAGQHCRHVLGGAALPHPLREEHGRPPCGENGCDRRRRCELVSYRWCTPLRPLLGQCGAPTERGVGEPRRDRSALDSLLPAHAGCLAPMPEQQRSHDQTARTECHSQREIAPCLPPAPRAVAVPHRRHRQPHSPSDEPDQRTDPGRA